MSGVLNMVCIVDDDASIRVGLDRLLRSAGFRVVTYEDGDQFLEGGRRDDCICVVLDMMMPGITGLDIQKKLNVESPGLPIIFISGHLQPSMRKQAIEQGAAAVFEKPFEGEAILNAIRQTIS